MQGSWILKDRLKRHEYWHADLDAQGLTRWHWHYRWTRPEIYFVKRLRAVELWRAVGQKYLLARPLYLFFRFRFGFLSERYGFTIPLGVFGPGLSIAHVGTIVVNSDARIGRDCRLHHGVTIGAIRGLAPEIGNEVFIGPGAGVYGGITVGDRVHIGPGVVITTDVPADSVVLPQRNIVRDQSHPTWRDDVRSRKSLTDIQ